jgi:hypothetical protein
LLNPNAQGLGDLLGLRYSWVDMPAAKNAGEIRGRQRGASCQLGLGPATLGQDGKNFIRVDWYSESFYASA